MMLYYTHKRPTQPRKGSGGVSAIYSYMVTILFIDGENFRYKCKNVVKASGKNFDWEKMDISGLIGQVLSGMTLDEKRYYASKIVIHPQSSQKSKQLQEQQRRLKTKSEQAGYQFIISGRVRGQEQNDTNGNLVVVFKEKGVDVRIAVDMVTLACDDKLDTAVLASSDSDLQPAIKEATKRGKEVIYLGFERGVNKGMTFTSSRTILIRDSEVLGNYSGS